MREVRAMNRAGRENQIVMVFTLMIERGQGDELGSYAIARQIGMRGQSPSFRDILAVMVRDGKLKLRVVQTNRKAINEGRMYMYSLGNAPQPKKREIKVKVNGVQVGQLRLI